MAKIWKVKIRQSIRNEFPKDPMMQELHEIRARFSEKYKPGKIRLELPLKGRLPGLVKIAK